MSGLQLMDTLCFEGEAGEVCVLSACRGGLFINHIYAPRAGGIFRYRNWLFSLARELGYGRVYCRPLDARLARIYQGRWGFVDDGHGGLFKEL